MKLHERKDMKVDDLSRNQRNIIALLEIIKEGSSSELSQKLGLPKRTFLDNPIFSLIFPVCLFVLI